MPKPLPSQVIFRLEKLFSSRILAIAFALIAASGVALAPGCSLFRVLFSPNIGPIDEKSQGYRIPNPGLSSDEWEHLDPRSLNGDNVSADTSATQSSDLTFQNRKNSALITLNSTCRFRSDPTVEKNGSPEQVQSLRQLARPLTLGFTEISDREEKMITVNGIPALQTTLVGKLATIVTHGPVERTEMRLRTVVFRHKTCNFDLIYIARPAVFEETAADFDRFAAAIELK